MVAGEAKFVKEFYIVERCSGFADEGDKNRGRKNECPIRMGVTDRACTLGQADYRQGGYLSFFLAGVIASTTFASETFNWTVSPAFTLERSTSLATL